MRFKDRQAGQGLQGDKLILAEFPEGFTCLKGWNFLLYK